MSTHPHFGFLNMGAKQTNPAAHLHEGPTSGELVLRAIRRHRGKLATVHADGSTLTYNEMGTLIAGMMQAFADKGLGRGDGVVVLAANDPKSFLVRLAANLSGMRYTSLNPMGSQDDHAYIVADSEAVCIVTDQKYAERIPGLRKGAPHVRQTFTLGPTNHGDDLLALAEASGKTEPWCNAEPDDIGAIIYTGGTTGRSKGAVHRHRSLRANVEMTLAEWDWPREVRTLCVTPLSHAAGSFVTPTLVKGGTVFIHEGFDPGAVLKAIERDKITVLWLVPTMIYVLLDHPDTANTDLSSLELIVYGAAPMSPTRLREALDVFGPVFMQIYAQTEAPMNITTLNIADHDPERPELLASCGQAQMGIQLKLLDDDGAEVPEGEVGEICVRGPLVMEEYWKRPEETAETLKGGWLHTGDMGRFNADGYLYIVDRKKDMIISGGFNVYPKEVEDVLTTHPDVAQAAVIGVPDEKWGEAVKAVIVLKEGASPDPEALIALVKEKKGSVLAPKTVDFASEIPLTAVGKPDKKALRARYWGDATRQVN